MQSLTLTTSDGVAIAADFYLADGDRFAVLLHMMPATKESWSAFAVALAEKGISSIAIDFRGHGASTGGPLGYREFTDAEHQAKIEDVRAAFAELQRRGATAAKTTVIGGSIGANLAIRFLAENSTTPCAVALSPGLDYHGVMTDDAVQKMSPAQKLLVVVSDEDIGSAKSVKKLAELNASIEVIEKSGIGHATAMLENDSELFADVIDWIDKRL